MTKKQIESNLGRTVDIGLTILFVFATIFTLIYYISEAVDLGFSFKGVVVFVVSFVFAAFPGAIALGAIGDIIALHRHNKTVYEKEEYNSFLKREILCVSLFFWSCVHILLYTMDGSLSDESNQRKYFYPVTDPYPTINVFDISNYDLTELTVYIVGAWLIFFLYYYLKDNNKA